MNNTVKPDKAERVHGVFESIARGYDSANDRISLGMQKKWKKMLTGRIIKQVPSRMQILDVCCGTGDISLEIARQRPDLVVTGIDFSEAMLNVARKKRDQKGLSNLLFFEGDALNLSFADDTFAAVTISFGLRNTADYGQAIKEMKRVLKPGGYMYCLDSFVPENPLIRPFYYLYFYVIMPFLGGGQKYLQEYRWLSESTKLFLQPKELMTMFRTHGMTRVRSRKRMFGACTMVWGRKE